MANRERQAQITQEISEIVGGANALADAEVSSHRGSEERHDCYREKKTSTDTAGRVVRITGPVVDVEFPRGSVPELFNALHAEITYKELAKTLTLEVAQHLGDNLVRTHLHAAHRRPGARRRGHRHRRLDLGARRRRRQGPRVQRARRLPRRSRLRQGLRQAGRSTASRRRSTSSSPAPRCWRPASRSSTCSPRTCVAARSPCSAVPASARRCSSRR